MTKNFATTTMLFATLMVIGCGGNTKPGSSTTAVVLTALDSASLELIAARQKAVRIEYKEAQDATKAAKEAVGKQKVKLEGLQDTLKNEKKRFDDATDDVTRDNAREHVEMLESDISIASSELNKLEGKLSAAQAHENNLFKQVFNLAGLGKVEDPNETNKTTEAIEAGFANLTATVKDGNKKTGELVTAVNGVAKSVDGVKTSVDGVAKSVDAQTAMLKVYCDRIDSFFKNFEKIYINNQTSAEKVVEALNKLEKAYSSAKTSGNTDEMKRIADALEKYLAEKAKAPAPVVTAAPVVAPQAYAPPQGQPGQYYAAPCQGSQCYQVRRW